MVDTFLSLQHSLTMNPRWLHDLTTLLAFPTISAQLSCRPAQVACARWLAAHLQRIGLQEVRLLPGYGGPPSVYGAWRGVPGQPTLLLYGHYDVQSPGDLRLWRTPPFRATARGQHLYARGASDDKGQLFMLLAALERCFRQQGRLPINVIVWLEGEEEVGSPHLSVVLARHRDLFRADALLVCDTEMALGRPSLLYGLRGTLSGTLQLTRRGGALHSGRYGGAAPDPAQALAKLLTGLRQVCITGEMAAQVRPVRANERRLLARAGADKRATIHPAFTITHLASGVRDAASVPAQASAQFNIRLVPDQQINTLRATLRRYVTTHTPAGLKATLLFAGAVPPVLLPRSHPALLAAKQAVQAVWGLPSVVTRSGGSIGPVAHFWHALRLPALLLGFGSPDDNIHAANERILLPNFFRGVETIVHLLEVYGANESNA